VFLGENTFIQEMAPLARVLINSITLSKSIFIFLFLMWGAAFCEHQNLNLIVVTEM